LYIEIVKRKKKPHWSPSQAKASNVTDQKG